MALLVVWLNTTDTKTALVILGLILVLFYKLDVQVTDRDVTFRFGIGPIRRKIPLDQIIDAKVVKKGSSAESYKIRHLPVLIDLVAFKR